MKRILTYLLMILLVCSMGANVFADTDVDFPNASGGNANATVNNIVGNTWKTFSTVVQILAVAVVVFAGLRYMFASADKRADIKKGMTYLVIGAILTFGASTISKFIVDAGKEIIK